jgi:hypothetical protein
VRQFQPTLADALSPIIIFAFGLPVMLYCFMRIDRLYRKFPSLVCPHCGGNLTQNKAVIIATGNCTSCGRRVLTDDSIGT